MKLKLFIVGLCTVGISVSEGMELTKDASIQKVQASIQHIPQDITLGIFSFIDYPTVARSRQVCKSWKVLIDEKLPLPQRYILKYLAQFVQKNNSGRTIKRFEEIFLTSLGKTALEDITGELQDDLSGTKEHAYQALLSSKLMSTYPSITLKISAGSNLEAKRALAFPYIPANLIEQDIKHPVNQDIRLDITGQQKNLMQIFGLGNLPAKILDRVTEISLDKISLLKIPRQLQKLQRLTAFTLNNSKLSSIPAGIGQLTNLQTLSLTSNQLSSIPAEIGQLTNLQWLYLNNNQLSSIPAEIRQMINLQALVLSNNELSSIQDEIGQLSNLQTLYLQNNELSSIPAEIGQLTKLQGLYLSNNQLSSIPAEIRQLTKLQELYLSKNQLSSIPAEIGQLTKLQRLYLDHNQLSNIPPELGQLSNLRELYLSNNQLSSIPAEIGQLTNLRVLDLSQNQLSSVPAAIEQLKRFGLMLSLDNNPLNKKCNIS